MSTRKLNPLPELSDKYVKRFWSHVGIRSDEECWPWKAARSRQGYGKFTIAACGKQVFVYCTRVAWLLGHGYDPHPLYVLHRCDNPPCCNPAHLFLGTIATNVSDMVTKERMTWRKLTHEMVDDIRSRLLAGETQCSIAQEYGVCHGTITDINRGKSWRHHTSLGVGPARIRPKRPQILLTFNGETKPLQKWAKTLGIARPTIYYRLRRGWTVGDALQTPTQRHYRKV